MPQKTSKALRLSMPVELIERRIYLIRGYKVIIDSDLAELYKVTTGNLNLAVRRNLARFPEDFMFQLSKDESDALLLQNARANKGRGGRQTPPYAFTELGVAMLSSVLKSERAVQMNIVIMRAFVRLRQVLASHRELARKIEQLHTTQNEHAKVLSIVVSDIQSLEQKVITEFRRLKAPRPKKARIGFYPEK